MAEPETPAERQARHFAWLRRTGDVAMSIADAAGAAAQAQIANPPQPGAPPKSIPNHARVFFQAAAAVRQIIALELRVEAGQTLRRPAAPKLPPKPDPRRPLLQKILHDAVRHDPDKARRRREIDADIERALLADPDPANAQLIVETLHAICTRLHIDLDLNRIPDAFLDYDEPIKSLTTDRPRYPQP